MKKLQNLWRNPTETFEEILSRKFRWIDILPLFAISGIYRVYYVIKAENGFNLSSNGRLLGSIMAIIVIGAFWGVISNLFLSFLVKVTGRIFKAENSMKKIITVFAWSSVPLILACVIIILSLTFMRIVLAQDGNKPILGLVLSVITILLNIGIIVPSIWSVFLVFKGLKIAQNLDRTKTILNYLLAIVIYFPIYYLIMSFKF